MKIASKYSIQLMALFYVNDTLGNDTPGNIHTGLYEPSWLVDIANLSVLIHLICGYQVCFNFTSSYTS